MGDSAPLMVEIPRVHGKLYRCRFPWECETGVGNSREFPGFATWESNCKAGVGNSQEFPEIPSPGNSQGDSFSSYRKLWSQVMTGQGDILATKDGERGVGPHGFSALEFEEDCDKQGPICVK